MQSHMSCSVWFVLVVILQDSLSVEISKTKQTLKDLFHSHDFKA